MNEAPFLPQIPVSAPQLLHTASIEQIEAELQRRFRCWALVGVRQVTSLEGRVDLIDRVTYSAAGIPASVLLGLAKSLEVAVLRAIERDEQVREKARADAERIRNPAGT